MGTALADVVTQEDLDTALDDVINSNNRIDDSNYYEVDGPLATISGSLPFVSSIASCLPGDFALSGQYVLFGENTISPTVDFFASTSFNPPTNWATEIVGNPGQGVRTIVNCFDNPPLR